MQWFYHLILLGARRYLLREIDSYFAYTPTLSVGIWVGGKHIR